MTSSKTDREFWQYLREWLLPRGASYKADLAKRIGITPRHLNRVLQGTSNLSAEARARVLAAMEADTRPQSSLRKWLRERKMAVPEFAKVLAISPKTVEDWVYRGKMPSSRNSVLVFSLTGLPQYAPRQHGDSPLTVGLQEQTRPKFDDGILAIERGKRAIAGVYRLIRDLEPLIYGPRTGRDYFRRQVAGADVGYLRSMLAALLDEEQLADWKRMSSYRPKRGGSM